MQDQHPERCVLLIAERDPSVRELQRHFLEQAGYTLDFADDGQAALDRAREARPSLIVPEILIPKLDGLALCRRLKEDPLTREIPVIVFSILAAAARAEEAGASAFLRKPFVETAFLGKVRELIAAQPIGAREEKWA